MRRHDRVSILLRVIGLALVFVYVFHENVNLPRRGETCEGTEDQISTSAAADYRFVTSISTFLSANDESVRVVALTPGVEPDEIMNNVCPQRRFLSLVIKKLKNAHAAVIVLDKSYSKDACAKTTEALADSNELLKVAQSDSTTKIIVGADTGLLPKADQYLANNRRVCCRLQPHLEFTNVSYGLGRFDRDTRRIPLKWPVASPDGPLFESLSFLTARTANKTILARPRLRRILGEVEDFNLSSAQNPLARINAPDTFPPISALKFLCGAKTTPDTDWRNCSTDLGAEENDVSGKIVMIGNHTDTELHDSVYGRMFGVDLHANYVAALLSDQIYIAVGDRIATGLWLAIWFITIEAIFFSVKVLAKAALISLALWSLIFVGVIVLSHLGYILMPWLQAVNLGIVVLTGIEHWLHHVGRRTVPGALPPTPDSGPDAAMKAAQ